MPNLLAMCFEGNLAPSFDLSCLRMGDDHHRRPDGWGVGYYSSDEPSAVLLKEAAPPAGSIRSELIRTWEQLASSLFILHIRKAKWGGISPANTQPFLASFGGRDWLFAHSGSLVRRLDPNDNDRFTPVGSTDSEAIFCRLLSKFYERGWRSMGDADLSVVYGWLRDLGNFGSVACVLADGRDLLAYADPSDAEGSMWTCTLTPPYSELVFSDSDVTLNLTQRGIKSRKGVIVSSTPLRQDILFQQIEWEQLAPGEMLVMRQGALMHRYGTSRSNGAVNRFANSEPPATSPIRYSIIHRTTYRYERWVERSTHLLRLCPKTDTMQQLLHHEISVSVPGLSRDFEDVFGNASRRLLLESSYNELVIEARSTVEVHSLESMRAGSLRTRSTIPLLWMPWQRHVLDPYLLPPELPESELQELTEYAMSFVQRNTFDLIDTLLDINQSIFKEYRYVQGATTVDTSPFDVYANRRGVCQDFTNLFICLARLLGIPARYVCGYIYTGPKFQNQAQSEASHAWVQLYLPDVGWRGFDPTNGVLTGSSHIQTAVGRNYLDATPTSGTIYVGGGPELLTVDVRVEPQ